MAVHLSLFLILTGLTGVHCIITVSKVSVKAGDSITVPCLYESKYKNYVKYLCKGSRWSSCSYATKTNQAHRSGKFSISDDKTQRIFTVTIRDVMAQDSHYWCAVEKTGPDDGQYFLLSVSSGTSSLYVDHQNVPAFIGTV
ncbi:hypothetical protein Q5P01_021545 [Channa striata]|uniref:Immunoglobulin domain-containing protein n=1 Tax=Channa striata TaxID=64152 RepID=A0AA88LUG8_CHASR|nr:hypothetical protein Q5P01_021545 [Channa striata]